MVIETFARSISWLQFLGKIREKVSNSNSQKEIYEGKIKFAKKTGVHKNVIKKF